jgi:hypothetical protein
VGEAKSRRQRLLRDNPNCCFCGGSEPSTEEDHIPPRSCFVARQWPEGFSFGACRSCNSETRYSELIAAFYIRWMDHEEANLVDSDLAKLMEGVKNNFPHLLPRTNLTRDEIEKAVRNTNYVHLNEGPAPIVAIPREVVAHLNILARKLLCAIHYLETKEIVPLNAYVWTNWIAYHDKRLPELLDMLDKALPTTRVGKRASRLLTDQFKYICGRNKERGLFGCVVQFGKSIAVSGATYQGENDQRLAGWATLESLLETQTVAAKSNT